MAPTRQALFFIATLGVASGVAQIGCATNVTVPQMYQQSFYADNKWKNYPVQGNISIVSDAILTYGSNALTSQPTAGVVTRECIVQALVDPTDHFLVAMVLRISEKVTVCLRFQFKPIGDNSFSISYSYQAQDNFFPPCDTTHHPPNRHLGNGYHITNTSVRYTCPLQGIIPQELIRAPVRSKCDVLLAHEIGVPCFEGFISSGWFVVRTPLVLLFSHPAPYCNCASPQTVRLAQPDGLRLLRSQHDVCAT